MARSFSRTWGTSTGHRILLTVVVTVAGLLVSSKAHASSVLDGYNLVVLDNLNDVHGVEGRTFVGGDLNAHSSQYGFGLDHDAGDDSHTHLHLQGRQIHRNRVGRNDHHNALIVTGKLNPYSKHKAQYKVYGDLSYNGITRNRYGEDVVGYHNSGESQHVAASSTASNMARKAKSLSSQLKAMPPNAGIALPRPSAEPADVVFDASRVVGCTAVFWIADGNKLFNNRGIRSIDFRIANVDRVIINVAGPSIYFARDFFAKNFIHNKKAQAKVIWNFYQAASLHDFGRSFYGTILAPNATLNAGRRDLHGEVVVNTLASANKVYIGRIAPDCSCPWARHPLPTPAMNLVPAPGSGPGAAAGLGLVMFCLYWHRRRKNKAST